MQVYWFVQPPTSEVHLLVQPQISDVLPPHEHSEYNSGILTILTCFRDGNVSCALASKTLQYI